MFLEHWYVLYFFITFIMGIFSLTISIIAYLKTKERLILYYLYVYLAFTLLISINLFFSYGFANFPRADSPLYASLDYIERIAIYLLIFTVPMLTHEVFSLSHRNARNIIVGGIVILSYVVSQLFELLTRDAPEAFSEIAVSDIFLLAMILYSFLLATLHYKTLHDPLRKRFAQKYMFILGASVVVALIDSLLNTFPPVNPTLFCGLGMMFAHHFIKYYLRHPQRAPETSTVESMPNNIDAQEIVSAESIFGRYALSPREKEVLNLLLQGYTNVKIGEALFISLSTVKTHIRKIFQKCDVKNRYQLITLFKHIALPPSPLEDVEDRADDSQENGKGR